MNNKVVGDNSVGVATLYGLDGSKIESRWRRGFPQPSRPSLGPIQPREVYFLNLGLFLVEFYSINSMEVITIEMQACRWDNDESHCVLERVLGEYIT